MCTIRIHPHNWTTSCDISASGRVAARPSDVPFTPAGRSDVWPSNIRIEEIKATVYRDFLLTSRTHHDQRLHNFCRLAAAKCGFPNRASTGILYMRAAPWCKHLYVGQTGTYGWKRMRTHVYAVNAGSDTGKLYDQMRKMHISRFVFLPVCNLSVVAPYHADRLFLEAQAISLLPLPQYPGLTDGQGWSQARCLCHCAHSQATSTTTCHEPEASTRTSAYTTASTIATCPSQKPSCCTELVSSHAGRCRRGTPSPVATGRCNNQALCTLIANWPPRQSLKILSCAIRCLNQSSKGIFLYNFAKVRGSFTVVKHCFRTPLHFDGSLRRSLSRYVRDNITREYLLCRRVVVVFLTFRARLVPNIVQLCDNTRQTLAMPTSDVTCPCHMA